MGCSLVTLFEVAHHILLIFLKTGKRSVNRIQKTIRLSSTASPAVGIISKRVSVRRRQQQQQQQEQQQLKEANTGGGANQKATKAQSFKEPLGTRGLKDWYCSNGRSQERGAGLRAESELNIVVPQRMRRTSM